MQAVAVVELLQVQQAQEDRAVAEQASQARATAWQEL
jgi:hypothetical protein